MRSFATLLIMASAALAIPIDQKASSQAAESSKNTNDPSEDYLPGSYEFFGEIKRSVESNAGDGPLDLDLDLGDLTKRGDGPLDLDLDLDDLTKRGDGDGDYPETYDLEDYTLARTAKGNDANDGPLGLDLDLDDLTKRGDDDDDDPETYGSEDYIFDRKAKDNDESNANDGPLDLDLDLDDLTKRSDPSADYLPHLYSPPREAKNTE